jgi:tetratricopeptide (TPR) repeat protein
MGLRGRIVVSLGVLGCMSGVAVADSSHHHHHKKPAPKPAPAPAPEAAPAPEPPAPAADETPWGKGVSPERKTAALQLLNEGNELFVQNHFPEALAKYEEAIGQWDHPAIHFNIVRALLALDRPLEAEASLEKALAYGADPLEADHYAEAMSYKGLLAGRIGTVELSCKQADVRVKLDGADLLACPGSTVKKLLPGNHVVVSTKKGYQTESKDIVIIGGAKVTVGVTLAVIPPPTEYEYKSRWSTWKPWAVGVAGVAIAGGGVVLRVLAQRDLDELDDTFQNVCQPDCTKARYEELGLADDESKIESRSRIAVGTMIGGGVIAAAGIALVILNRPKPYAKERPAPSTAQLVPSVTPSGGGLTVVGRF